ncbi:unannotated protein [freshwater metagenome]|uniref:guanylate kinase n=1 Tax=freshwater metagenome TaxID=449393 RepID=A0A6J7XTH6_9ZZZZ|nr:guanylate kinase [Actinomycetota bacterium]
MSTPPKLTPQARAAALEKAKVSRQERAFIKASLKAGDVFLSDVLDMAQKNEAVGKMRVADLLSSLSGVGKVRAQSIMEKIGISPTRRIQGLGVHQLLALRKEFSIPTFRGKLFVLSGPGGVGKSTVAKELRKNSDFWVSISATTREPRANEIEGIDYKFLSNEEFDREIAEDNFLEWAAFAGSRYGSPRRPVETALASGRNVLLEIEIAGARQVKQHAPEAILVFLEPPSWEELVGRLEGRATDSPERRAQRLLLAQEELAAASFFDVVITNDQVSKVVDRLLSLA